MSSKGNNTVIGIAIIIILLVGSPVVLYLTGYYDDDTVTVTVTGKERVMKDQSSYYLIFSDKEVFTIQDTLIKQQWASSDIYGHIEEGKTYKFTVYGWRVPFLSWYRNIVSYQEI